MPPNHRTVRRIFCQFFIVVSGVIRVSRRAILAGVAEGGAGRDEEVNRLLAGSNFGAGELLAGR